MKSDIERYISASRIEKERPKNYSGGNERYEWIYENLLCHLDKDIKYPDLYLCYSINKSCEQVTINSKESYLIFDEALGKFMHNMDTLVLYPKTSYNDIDLFLNKCFAESYYSSGQYMRAFLQEIYCEELEKQIPYRLADVFPKNTGRNIMVLLQEIFVILHEISHYRLAQLSREQYNEKINKHRRILLDRDAALAYYEKRANSDCSEYSETEKKLLDMYGTDQPISFWEARIKSLKAYYADDKNIEEIMCDEFALSTMLELKENVFPPGLSLLYNIENKLLPIMVCQACYIGLQNLNILSQCEIRQHRHDLDDLSTGERLNASLPDALRRKICFIDTIILTTTDNKPKTPENRDITKFWSKTFKDINDKYDSFYEVLKYRHQPSCSEKMKKRVSSIKSEEMTDHVEQALEIIRYW